MTAGGSAGGGGPLPATASLIGSLVFAALAISFHTTTPGSYQFESLSRSDFLMAVAFTGAVWVVAFVFARATRELSIPDPPTTLLGSGGYDIKPLQAPAASGLLLRILAKIVTNHTFGHIIRRQLLNENSEVDTLRSLAHQAARQEYPVVFFPMARKVPRAVTNSMADTATEALQKGLPISYDNSQVVGVMDYYNAYSARTVSPSQMMTRVLDAAMGETLAFMNIFVQLDREKVMEQARICDQRWKAKSPRSVFEGVPITVKDMIMVKGFINRNGMRARKSDVVSEVDDIMVQRFRNAGAIIIGTTVMTEFGRCPLGYSSHDKGPFNPYDERCYSGGSSAGSVVSVMTGLVPIGISFDGGGSIRLPASFSGAFGLAPTYGRVPYDSLSAKSTGMVHAGVNTATTTDTALAYALLAQNKPGHFFSELFDGDVSGPPKPHLAEFDSFESLTGIRIGVFYDYLEDSDPQVASSCENALKVMEQYGAEIVEVVIPHLRVLSLSHGMSISMDMSNINDGEFYHRHDFEPATMIQLGLGKSMSGVEFLAANRMRGWAIDYCKGLFSEKIDVFLTPGCPIIAPQIPVGALSCGESNTTLVMTVMRYIFLANLCGFPGMAMPIGYSDDKNLPISLHLMADHWNDAMLIRLSHFVEKKIFHRKTPKHFIKLSLG